MDITSSAFVRNWFFARLILSVAFIPVLWTALTRLDDKLRVVNYSFKHLRPTLKNSLVLFVLKFNLSWIIHEFIQHSRSKAVCNTKQRTMSRNLVPLSSV